MSAIGAFTFVLHSHLPYARLAGMWPHGEEWIHEAASETYIPLLRTLYDLKEDGVKFKLTVGITPILAEQLADPLVLEHFDIYLDSRIEAAKKDMIYFEGGVLEADEDINDVIIDVEDEDEEDEEDDSEDEEDISTVVEPELVLETAEDLAAAIKDPDHPKLVAGAERFEEPAEEVSTADPHLRYMAEWYLNWYEAIKRDFDDRFGRDIIGAFRQLQDEGYIEVSTCAATHGYLPLLGRDSSINAQLKAGVTSYERMFGRPPTAIWLPECAYRPAYITEGGKKRPGLEHFLAENGLKVFFSETHTITGGQPVGVAAGEVIGPYGEVQRRYVIPAAKVMPERPATTYKAYQVTNTTGIQDGEIGSGVYVMGRNNRSGQQVWSADWGYPGDFDYREFHKKAGTSGLQYWRVSGKKVELGFKDYYHPDWAAIKVEQHAEHFAHLVGDLLREYYMDTGEFGLIAANFDTELFGHWWFEGIDWIGKVLRLLSEDPDVQLTSASTFIEEHPPQEILTIPEGSWGAGGTHFVWDNNETHWMWRPIRESEMRMEKLVKKFPKPDSVTRDVLNQTARELLLLQSSDWPFLVTTAQAREYAIQRFSQHMERFIELAESLEADAPNAELAARLWELDKVFPDIDYRWFAER